MDTHRLAKIGINPENWGPLYVAILFTGREILDMFRAITDLISFPLDFFRTQG
jgi:hypothetical protein